jgi:hypothetical protein
MLSHRHDGNHRRLRQDVADVARLEEMRRQQADHDDEQHEDQQWPDAKQSQADGDRAHPARQVVTGQCACSLPLLAHVPRS